MDETLLDIREKIKNNFYQNEEHIRLSLVARILYKIGWNIWDPLEVNTEFKVVPKEDYTKVDLALFFNKYSPPSVFIEVKALGKIDKELFKIEQQLRDYNRNNTAQFSLITDGQKWRFYFSQTGGEFSNKCFKTLDLLKDDIIDIIEAFNLFLSKEKILSGEAVKEAERLLKLNQKQRALEDAFPKAKRMVSEPPFPSLPQALVELLSKIGFEITIEEAKIFASNYIERKPQSPEIPKTTFDKINIRKKTVKTRTFPPNGTKCRFRYKDNTYYGMIVNGKINVAGFGSYKSFSNASVNITGTSRNGWRDWELKLPNSDDWILADRWRSSLRSENIDEENEIRKDKKIPWLIATRNAIKRYCQKHNTLVFSLGGLIKEELDNIKRDTQTKGKTPINSLQYYLQVLRDQGEIQFLDNNGNYKLISIIK